MKMMSKVFGMLIGILFFQLFPVQSQVNVDFMEFNVWQEGTSVSNGLNKIRDVIVEADPDIVGFVEVRNYNNEDWTTKIVNALSAVGHDYEGVFAGGDVSLISKYPITGSELIYDQSGSIVRFDVDINGTNVIVAVAHLDYMYYACYLPRGYNGGYPNWEMIDDGTGNPDPVLDIPYILEYNLDSQRDEQIAAFLNSVENETDPVILMGDFNEPSYADWTENNSTMFDHNGLVIPWQNVFTLTENGFTDAFREYFPNEIMNPGITWPSFADGVGSTSWTPLADERDRIDFMLYKGNDIEPSYAALVGPRESYSFNQPDTSFTSFENFIADNLPWPSDHKATYITLKFSQITGSYDRDISNFISVYPNPAIDKLNITTDKIYKSIHIELLNANGEKVYDSIFDNKQSILLDIESFVSGIYILRVQVGNKTVEKKVVIK
jgi:hypothetical protein